MPERKQWRQRGRSPGASAILLSPSRRAPGEAGRAVERGDWVRPRDPPGRRREVEAAGARAEHERPVAEAPQLPGLRGDARAGGWQQQRSPAAPAAPAAAPEAPAAVRSR